MAHSRSLLRNAICVGHFFQAGYTMLELAVVLAIISLAMGAGFSVYGHSQQQVATAQSGQQMAMAQAQLQRFMLSMNRLPCPDNSGDGVEDCPSSGATPVRVGSIPYRTLGMNAPAVDSLGQPLLYGANGSLQQLTTVTLADWDYAGSAQVELCLNLSAIASSNFSSDELTVAAAGHDANDSVCGEADGAFNPALIIMSGGDDANMDATAFDGLNSAAALGASLCVENPDRAITSAYDDQVVIAGISELYGLLCLKSNDSQGEG